MTDYTNLDKFQVSDIVKNWLEGEGHLIHDFEDVNADRNYYINKGNTNISIGFHKNSKDSLIISGKIGLSPEEQNMFKYLKIKEEFLSDIKIDFLRLNLEVIINKNITPKEVIITDITLQKTLYFDGLSKDRFYDISNSIFNCLQILRIKFLLLGKPKDN